MQEVCRIGKNVGIMFHEPSKRESLKISVEYLTVKDVGHSNKIIDGLEDRVLDYFDGFKLTQRLK